MRRSLLAATALVALAGAACGTGDNPALEAPTAAPEETAGPVEVPEGAIRVELTEFEVTLGESSAPAGEVTFGAENAGEIDHEFVVIDTDLAPDELPEDGGGVDTEAEGLEVVDEIENVSPGSTEVLTADLEAGSYVLICNIAGHYSSGMHASFTAE